MGVDAGMASANACSKPDKPTGLHEPPRKTQRTPIPAAGKPSELASLDA